MRQPRPTPPPFDSWDLTATVLDGRAALPRVLSALARRHIVPVGRASVSTPSYSSGRLGWERALDVALRADDYILSTFVEAPGLPGDTFFYASWKAARYRLPRSAFDHISISISAESRRHVRCIPAMLTLLCEASRAIHGHADSVPLQLIKNDMLGFGSNETLALLRCIPWLAPVTWLGDDLTRYVGGVRRLRSAGLDVDRARNGCLLRLPGWHEVTTFDTALAIQARLGKQFFYKHQQVHVRDRVEPRYARSPFASYRAELEANLRKRPRWRVREVV